MAIAVDPVELRVEELHRQAAAAIRKNASFVSAAADLLDRWIAREGSQPDPVLLEWKAVFDFLRPEEIADFLENPSPFARRLRSSSPFLPLVRGRSGTAG
ncbi:MAG TPA: hypothetical protein VF765_10995 [Polyangiaceae bacterium]